MKKTLLFFLFLCCVSLKAQVPSDTLNIKSPKIVCNVEYGQTVGFGDHSIKFVEVLSDSRCPEKVTCVWAGEAKVLLEISNGNSVEEKTVTFGASQKTIPLFLLKRKSVEAYGLKPYPVQKPILDKERYVLQLVLKERIQTQ